jgi:hypothetical protein
MVHVQPPNYFQFLIQRAFTYPLPEVFLAVMLLEPLTLSLVPRKIIMNYINYYLQSAHDSYICGFIHCRAILFNYTHCSPNESVDICLWPLLTVDICLKTTPYSWHLSYDHSLQTYSLMSQFKSVNDHSLQTYSLMSQLTSLSSLSLSPPYKLYSLLAVASLPLHSSSMTFTSLWVFTNPS